MLILSSPLSLITTQDVAPYQSLKKARRKGTCQYLTTVRVQVTISYMYINMYPGGYYSFIG